MCNKDWDRGEGHLDEGYSFEASHSTFDLRFRSQLLGVYIFFSGILSI